MTIKTPVSRFLSAAVLAAFLLTFSLANAGADLPAQSSFKFAVLGDSQFQHPDVFEDVVSEVNLLKPAFVIQIGDLIHGYQYSKPALRAEWARFKAQIAPLTMPYYPVPGNHDVTTTEGEQVYAEVWGNHRFYYSFDYENSHFIVLDAYYHDEYEKIGAAQMDFLKRDLASHASAANIFVFLHPPFDLDASSGWEKIHAILKEYPVRIVFNGHSHMYNFHDEDGIRYINLNSSGIMGYNYFDLGWGHEFVIVSVQGEDVTVAVVRAGCVSAEDLATSQSRKRAAKYVSRDRVIEIPDPARHRLKIQVPIIVENRADTERQYVLDWAIPDARWDVSPLKERFTIPPNSKRTIAVRLHVPKGRYAPSQFPYATVFTPYETDSGKRIILHHRYSLMVPRKAIATPTDTPILLDGRLDEPVWQQAPPITDFQLDKNGTISPDLTLARFLYDEKYLYVGIWGVEPNPAGMRVGAAGTTPLVFGDDSFQLFLDTNRDHDTFFRFMTNAAGTKFSSGPEGLNKYPFDVATHVGKDYWSAEFRIPFKELGVPAPKPPRRSLLSRLLPLASPPAPTAWGLNIRRARYQSTPPNSNWSAMDEIPYEPQRFGILRFE